MYGATKSTDYILNHGKISPLKENKHDCYNLSNIIVSFDVVIERVFMIEVMLHSSQKDNECTNLLDVFHVSFCNKLFQSQQSYEKYGGDSSQVQ